MNTPKVHLAKSPVRSAACGSDSPVGRPLTFGNTPDEVTCMTCRRTDLFKGFKRGWSARSNTQGE